VRRGVVFGPQDMTAAREQHIVVISRRRRHRMLLCLHSLGPSSPQGLTLTSALRPCRRHYICQHRTTSRLAGMLSAAMIPLRTIPQIATPCPSLAILVMSDLKSMSSSSSPPLPSPQYNPRQHSMCMARGHVSYVNSRSARCLPGANGEAALLIPTHKYF
jgi:hypothetical protein